MNHRLGNQRIVGDPIAATDRGPAIAENVPRKAHTRTECLTRGVIVEIRIELVDSPQGGGRKCLRLDARNEHRLLPQTLPPRSIDVPTQAQRQGQATGGLPGVLAIESHGVIMTRRHTAGTLLDVYRCSQEEIRYWVFRNAAIKCEGSGGGAAIGSTVTDTFHQGPPLEFMGAMDPIPILRQAVITPLTFIDGGRRRAEVAVYGDGREAFYRILVHEIGRSQISEGRVHRVGLIVDPPRIRGPGRG